MALTKSLQSLISGPSGAILTEFAGTRPDAWAREHIRRRYNATPPEDHEGPFHPARRCYNQLLTEYSTVRNWFSREGQLSSLLMGKSVAQIMTAPIGDGYGWDFKPSGEIEPRMLQFKGTLIACQRMAELKMHPTDKPDHGSAEIGGIARLVRGAYTVRSELCEWPQSLGGAEAARRWVSFHTFTFLLRCGVQDTFAWTLSKCPASFGDVPDV